MIYGGLPGFYFTSANCYIMVCSSLLGYADLSTPILGCKVPRYKEYYFQINYHKSRRYLFAIIVQYDHSCFKFLGNYIICTS